MVDLFDVENESRLHKPLPISQSFPLKLACAILPSVCAVAKKDIIKVAIVITIFIMISVYIDL
jgi:hypothetical protein